MLKLLYLILILFFFYLFSLIHFSFFFLFLLFCFLNNEEAHDCSYMMRHITLCYRSRILLKELEENDIKAYAIC